MLFIEWLYKGYIRNGGREIGRGKSWRNLERNWRDHAVRLTGGESVTLSPR